jgi:hypothetical protein
MNFVLKRKNGNIDNNLKNGLKIVFCKKTKENLNTLK